jgi:hypothetical protein
MSTEKSKVFNISRNFPILCFIVKLLGLYPLTAFEKDHKVRWCGLLLTLCNIVLLVYFYNAYLDHQIEEITFGKTYENNLLALLRNSLNFFNILSLLSIFVSLFINKSKFGRLVEKFTKVNESFAKINYCATRPPKKSYIVMSGTIAILFVLQFAQIRAAVRIHMHQFGDWPGLFHFVALQGHLIYKLAAALLFWTILHEVKSRFVTLKNVLENFKI